MGWLSSPKDSGAEFFKSRVSGSTRQEIVPENFFSATAVSSRFFASALFHVPTEPKKSGIRWLLDSAEKRVRVSGNSAYERGGGC